MFLWRFHPHWLLPVLWEEISLACIGTVFRKTQWLITFIPSLCFPNPGTQVPMVAIFLSFHWLCKFWHLSSELERPDRLVWSWCFLRCYWGFLWVVFIYGFLFVYLFVCQKGHLVMAQGRGKHHKTKREEGRGDNSWWDDLLPIVYVHTLLTIQSSWRAVFESAQNKPVLFRLSVGKRKWLQFRIIS